MEIPEVKYGKKNQLCTPLFIATASESPNETQVISKSTTEAEGKQANATEKEENLKVESEQIAVEKAEAEAALEEAIPALEEAAAALRDLKKDDITEIRSFSKPHVLVQKVILVPCM